MTVAAALERYLREVPPTKKPSTQKTERRRAIWLAKEPGRYSLTALTPEAIASYRTSPLGKA